MKRFSEEIKKFYEKLKCGEHFAFSRYGDGEWLAIRGIKAVPGNGEWTIDERSLRGIGLLIDSFTFKEPGYYVGISCPCCQGVNHQLMKAACRQDEEHLTFANLFVNSNYEFYIRNFIPEYQKRNIILVANRGSDLAKLPFDVHRFYGVGYNAWVEDLSVADLVVKDCLNSSDCVYLFSCGPLASIMAQRCWVANKKNTYLNIGSTIDVWLNNDARNKRLYSLDVPEYSRKVCVWS